MSKHKQLEQVFVVKGIAPAGLELYDLRPFQVAIFDEETQRTVASPQECRGGAFTLAYKAPGQGNGGRQPDQNNIKIPIKSLPITKVDRVTAFEGATDERKVFEAYLGYNGISPCKSISFGCGETYQLVLHMKGKPVRDLMGKASHTEIIPVVTGCCEDCSIDEAAKTTLGRMVEAIRENSQYFSRFFDVHPIYDCCPAPAPFPKVDFQDYCMTICDDGSAGALGDVQVKYQDATIYRSAREGGLSTYRTDCLLTAPADYVQQGTKLTDCATCPSGFTVVVPAKKFLVQIDNAGLGTTPAMWLAEVQLAGGFSAATAATRLSFRNGVSTYEVLVPSTFVEPVAPIADTTWTVQGDVDGYCLQTVPVTVPWTQCGTKYKITRKLCMTLRVNECGDPAKDLADLQAAFANNKDVVPASLVQTDVKDCVATYEVEQYSPCLEDGCDWFGKDTVQFSNLPGYNGQVWENCECEGWTFDVSGCPVPPVSTLENCQGGLKFVGKNFETDLVECATDIFDEPETEGVELEVSIGQFKQERCETLDIPFWVAQRPSEPNSLGINWLRREVKARSYSKYTYHSPNEMNGSIMAARRGEIYGVDPSKLYNHVDVYHLSTKINGTQQMYVPNREVIHLLVESGKSALLNQVKTMVNGIAEAQNLCKLV